MSLTIKAYLDKVGEEPEIRRFAVDTDVSSNFSYLTNRITAVFGSLAEKSFEVSWKDNEGDLVAFSSDEELIDGLGFVNDGIFRIHIREKKTTPHCTNEGQKHPGVVCDSCNSEICGSRFKCLECQDFDLCSVCENKGDHAEHRMLRLRSPDKSPFGSWEHVFGPGSPPPHHGPPPMGPFGGPPGFGGPGMGGPPGYGGPGMGGPGFAGPGCAGPGGRPGWPFRKMMKRCWRQWMKNMWQQNPSMFNQSNTEDDVKCKEPRTDGACGSEKNQCGENEKGDGAEGGEQQQDSEKEEYLRNVGDSVAAMLDPLGISVDVDVDQQGKRKRCHGGSGRGRFGSGRGGCRQDWTTNNPWGANPWAAMFGMGRGGSNPWGQGSSGQESETNTSQTSQDGSPGRPDGETVPEPNSAEATAPPAGDIHMNSPPHHSEADDSSWLLLNKDKNDMEAKPSSPASSTTDNAPSEPQTRVYPSLPHHPDPKINESLKQLLAMGFTNDGGWLTSLLISKNGDLNKVLDALKPHKPQ